MVIIITKYLKSYLKGVLLTVVINVKIQKINNYYEITNSIGSIQFSQEKWEDLYYSVPLSTGNFHRLLQDNICSDTESRLLLRKMLDVEDENVLDDLQKQIQNMPLS